MMREIWMNAVPVMAPIFSILLALSGNRERKKKFALRLAVCIAGLCLADGMMRYFMRGMGQSVYSVLMSILFMGAYAVCFRTSSCERIYSGGFALAAFELAQNAGNVLKSIAERYATSVCLWKIPVDCVAGCIGGAAVCAALGLMYRRMERTVRDVPVGIMVGGYAAFAGSVILFEMCGSTIREALTDNASYYICAVIYAVVGCAAWIVAGQWAHERHRHHEMQTLLDERAQYEAVNREGMEELYIRCHDLKHQLSALRTRSGNGQMEEYLSQLEETMRTCGTRVECGNEALNVVLTQKNALCAAEGIHFSYMIDGALFDFLSETEVYSLFGNILDNALEASRKVKDATTRMISLKAAAKGDMVIIHAENVFEGSLTIKDGLPKTDKQGSGHGFGLRSVERTAKRYGGTLAIRTEGQIFKLTAVMNPRIVI